MFEFFVPVGAKVPLPHYYESFDETVYGLEGVMTFTVDGKTIELEKGKSIFISKGVVHGFNNLSQQDAKVLAVTTPGLMGAEYFQELAVIINAGGPPDMEKIKAVFKKHGLVPVSGL
jgi:quercetin dioxygenase-like cupin family protein